MNRQMARLVVLGTVLSVVLVVSGASVRASGENGLAVLDIPEDRGAMALAYDGDNHEVVMFGGCCDENGARLGDTWTWTPSSGWVQQSPDHSPTCRNSSRMIYDQARGEIVLFGGVAWSPPACTSGATRQADTWTWNGTDWTQEFPTTSPPARSSMAFAYDPRGNGSVVMFGGNGTTTGSCSAQAVCDDTWVWDGITWTKCDEGSGGACETTRPDKRASGAMAYHAERGDMLMAGGRGGQGVGLLDDTWDWGGVDVGWAEVTAVGSFGARTTHRVAYDP